MATKNNPGKYDCYENADPDEPMFILLARDITAPWAIRDWVAKRILAGKNEMNDEQIQEALECADDMDDWFFENITK